MRALSLAAAIVTVTGAPPGVIVVVTSEEDAVGASVSTTAINTHAPAASRRESLLVPRARRFTNPPRSWSRPNLRRSAPADDLLQHISDSWQLFKAFRDWPRPWCIRRSYGKIRLAPRRPPGSSSETSTPDRKQTPAELAQELGIHPSTLNVWLRRTFPRARSQRGRRWVLTNAQRRAPDA